jgi:twinfilin-like protein
MLYSSGVAVFVNDAKKKGLQVIKRTETSDPSELNETFLMQELGHHATESTPTGSSERVAFAKPRGPPRRR